MNALQINKLRMYANLQLLLKEYKSEWEQYQGIAEKVFVFNSLLSRLNEVASEKLFVLAGVANSKYDAREKLAEKVEVLARVAKVVAVQLKDYEMLDEVRITARTIRKSPQEKTVVLVERLLYHLSNNVQLLLDYGVKQEEIDDLEMLLVDFKRVKDGPALARAKRKALTEELKDIYNKIDEVIVNYFDNLMPRFSFYGRYKAHRKVRKVRRKKKRISPGREEQVNDQQVTNSTPKVISINEFYASHGEAG